MYYSTQWNFAFQTWVLIHCHSGGYSQTLPPDLPFKNNPFLISRHFSAPSRTLGLPAQIVKDEDTHTTMMLYDHGLAPIQFIHVGNYFTLTCGSILATLFKTFASVVWSLEFRWLFWIKFFGLTHSAIRITGTTHMNKSKDRAGGGGIK